MPDKPTMKAPFSSTDISAMAREAGLTDPSLGEWMIDYGNAKEEIKKFAVLVADKAVAKELEACAQMCDRFDLPNVAVEIRARIKA